MPGQIQLSITMGLSFIGGVMLWFLTKHIKAFSNLCVPLCAISTVADRIASEMEKKWIALTSFDAVCRQIQAVSDVAPLLSCWLQVFGISVQFFCGWTIAQSSAVRSGLYFVSRFRVKPVGTVFVLFPCIHLESNSVFCHQCNFSSSGPFKSDLQSEPGCYDYVDFADREMVLMSSLNRQCLIKNYCNFFWQWRCCNGWTLEMAPCFVIMPVFLAF